LIIYGMLLGFIAVVSSYLGEHTTRRSVLSYSPLSLIVAASPTLVFVFIMSPLSTHCRRLLYSLLYRRLRRSAVTAVDVFVAHCRRPYDTVAALPSLVVLYVARRSVAVVFIATSPSFIVLFVAASLVSPSLYRDSLRVAHRRCLHLSSSSALLPPSLALHLFFAVDAVVLASVVIVARFIVAVVVVVVVETTTTLDFLISRQTSTRMGS
jgi:hypothetical protein